ncbi:MAG: twin-arginine translocation signal domain-containing protein, partial [Verrucomicrobia bacterium]|nr:twin-arginine translocation signal domain-containing protein [Verrucomicrobiota bacterium]
MKNSILNRRRFLQHSAAGVTAAALAKRHSLHAANKAANKLRVGVIGLGRGMAHVKNYLKLSDVEVAYVCDVDDNRTANGLSVVTKSQAAACRGITDLRRMLDDPHLD